MGFYVGRGRKARRAFGFDEVAIVPGRVTINPEEVDTTWELGDLKFDVPILAAAMDGVVDTNVAMLVATHDRSAARIASRQLVLSGGVIADEA